MTEQNKLQFTGCAVCNPELQKPYDEVIAQHRKDVSDVLHVARIGEGFHVLQIPGECGDPCTDWMGPFDSERAAEMFRESLIANAVEGNPGNACCSGGVAEHYNLLDQILSIIEGHDGDALSLASQIVWKEPWNSRRPTTPLSSEIDDIPF